MKSNKKNYLILVLVMMLISFNVMAVDDPALIPGTDTGNTGSEGTGEGITTPSTGTEGEQTPSTPDTGGTGSEEPEEEETTTPETPDDQKKEEVTEDETTSDEEVIEEEQKTEEQTNTTTTRPYIDYSTTIIDNKAKRVEIVIYGKDNEVLSGIKFQIQDKKGNIFYEEETTETGFVFEKLELGTYYLVQVNKLEGYEENTERFEFVVSEDSETVKVEVTNKLEKAESKETKKEKDVFGMGAPLLCSIAMFDISLCIGILIYVKKNRKKVKAKDKNKK